MRVERDAVEPETLRERLRNRARLADIDRYDDGLRMLARPAFNQWQLELARFAPTRIKIHEHDAAALLRETKRATLEPAVDRLRRRKRAWCIQRARREEHLPQREGDDEDGQDVPRAA